MLEKPPSRTCIGKTITNVSDSEPRIVSNTGGLMNDFQESWGEKKPGFLARALSALRKTENALAATEKVLDIRQPKTETQPLSNKLLRGWDVPVVGESFHSESFRRLYSLSLKTNGREILETATLTIDPTNSNSKSGKAVAVFIQGQKVGYVAERICEIVFDGLVQLGGSAQCDCNVYFDTSSGEFRYNSVVLRMILPPTLESTNTGAKLPSLKKGQILHRLGNFKISPKAGSLLQDLTVGEVFYMSMNYEFSDNHVEVTSVEGDSLFSSQVLQQPLPLSTPAGGKLYYVDTKAKALGFGEFEMSLLATEQVKVESTRTGDAVSDAGNVLSSRYELGVIPSAAWLKIKYEKRLLQAPGSELFVPGPMEHTKYFWARLSQGPELWNQLGFRGSLYAANVDKLSSYLSTVPPFWVLVRATAGKNGSNPTFEAAFESEALITLFPQRPISPSKALTSKNFVVSSRAPEKSEVKTVDQTPQIAISFSLESLNDREITTTGFDYLQQSYLVPALEALGYRIGDSVTKSRTGVLVGGSYFDVRDSSKAKAAARFGIPIITSAVMTETLKGSLEQDEKYRAFCRYETWLESIGLVAPHSWTDASSSFDFRDVDAVLIPGAALDDRNVFSTISFIGALVGLAESKTQLAEFFELLGGKILDSMVTQATISFINGNSGLVMELHRNGVFLGRTPANQTESLAESARIYSLTDAWVKINWLASGKFKAEFSFFGHS